MDESDKREMSESQIASAPSSDGENLVSGFDSSNLEGSNSVFSFLSTQPTEDKISTGPDCVISVESFPTLQHFLPISYTSTLKGQSQSSFPFVQSQSCTTNSIPQQKTPASNPQLTKPRESTVNSGTACPNLTSIIPSQHCTTTSTGGLGHLLSSKKRKTRRANAPGSGYNNVPYHSTTPNNLDPETTIIATSETTSIKSFMNQRHSLSETESIITADESQLDQETPYSKTQHSTDTHDPSYNRDITSIHQCSARNEFHANITESDSCRNTPFHHRVNPSFIQSSPIENSSGFNAQLQLSPQSLPFIVQKAQPTPPPPPPPQVEQDTDPSRTRKQMILSSWDVSEKLISEFRRIQRQEDEIGRASAVELFSFNQQNSVTLAKIRCLFQKIEQLKSLQNQKVEEENFGEAELIDEEIKRTKTELLAVESSAVSPFDRFLQIQLQLLNKSTDKLTVLDLGVEELCIAREGVLQEAKERAAFESTRGSNEVERLKFEVERLNLELGQIMKQFNTIDSESRQVEERIDKVTTIDREERDEALNKKMSVDSEVEHLQQLLSEKLREQQQLAQAIGACDIRIASARSKFKKQLTRLETSKTSLEIARREVINERRQLQQLRSSIWTQRQEAERRLDRLLCEVSYITIGIEELKRCVKIPLKIVMKLRKKFIESMELASSDVWNSDVELKNVLHKIEKRRNEIDGMTQIISQLRVEKTTIQQQIGMLNSRKVSAIATRSFREAGTITEKIKDIEEKGKKIDEEIARLKNCAEELSLELIEDEKEEKQCREDVELHNQTRAELMVSIIDEYATDLKKYSSALKTYCDSNRSWIGKAKEIEPDRDSSWTAFTLIVLDFIKRFSQANDDGNTQSSDENEREGKASFLVHHPIQDQLKIVMELFEESFLPLIESEIEDFEKLKNQWDEEIGLKKEKDIEEKIEKDKIDMNELINELMEEKRSLEEQEDKFIIEEEFRECEQFLKETRELSENVEEGLESDDVVKQFEELFATDKIIEKNEMGLKVENHVNVDMNQKIDVPLLLVQDNEACNGCIEEDNDGKRCNKKNYMEHENHDDSGLSVSEDDINRDDHQHLTNTTMTSSPPEEQIRILELIHHLETQLEKAVSLEDYNLAASLDEQIEQLRSKP